MKKKVLITATVQSHICQFHKPLVQMLHDRGYEVHAAARNNLAEKNGLKLDFVDKVFDVPFARSPKSPDNIKAYKQLKKIIDNEGYDIIHCNTPMGGIVTRLAARKARKKGTTVIYTAHGFHFYKGASKKTWLFFYPVEKLFARLTDKLITITQEDYILAKAHFKCEVFRTHGVGVDARRYYPVDSESKKNLREQMNIASESKVILCVGELLPNKNQKTAVFALDKIRKMYPEALLLIAGNGPEKANLQEIIKAKGLEKNVKLLGYVTNLQDYQRIADAAVSCSRREGLPLNIVEAMMSGTPVVASNNRGHRELIQDGENGFLFNIDNADVLADRVIDIFKNSDLRKTISQNALVKSSLYSYYSVKKELENVYCVK